MLNTYRETRTDVMEFATSYIIKGVANWQISVF